MKKIENSDKMTEKIKLKVLEALQDDAYKGVARIDTEIMKSLGLKRGDVVSIKGERETVAIVDRSYPADVDEGIIRIDGLIRRNSKTGIGENVEIKKANIKPARSLTLAPAGENTRMIMRGDQEGVIRSLLGRALVKGDLLRLGGTQRRMDIMQGDLDSMDDFISNVFGQFGFGSNNMRNPMGGSISQQAPNLVVVSVNPSQPVIITERTKITLKEKGVSLEGDESAPDVTYEDIGGLKEEVKKIREMVELPLKHPEVFDRLGVEPPKGVLLHGTPGTGKTLLARAVANESEANFILLNGPEIMSKFYGESEKKIRDLFEEAEKNAPTIIFIDEIDAIAPKREDVQGEVERRVVSQLLTMMDGLNSRGKVVVIGATNRVNSLDPALRRPGRFDREISISVPDKKGRLNILKIHTRNMPLKKDVKLEVLAAKTHGFVGADIESLAKESAMNVIRKLLPEIRMDEEEEIPQEILNKMIIGKQDFEEALKVVRPSAMREVLVEAPNIGWEDVGGLEKTKQSLKEAVEWPIKYKESFEHMGIRPPKGILLYGSPGTGKTLLAKAVAKESEANFIQVKGPSLLSMWVGKSEEGIRKIFERARQVSPCVVFFDEIDALAGKRGMEAGGTKVTERVLNQLLAEIDGLEDLKDVTIIGATNRPDMLDSALLRPGRFDRIILVDIPNKEGRKKILEIHTRNMPLDKTVKMQKLIEKTEGFVGADLESLTREAAIIALRKDMKSKTVKMADFEEALSKMRPSVSEETAKRYKKMEEHYMKAVKSEMPVGPIYTG